jgi:hypothetical protein
VIYKDRPGFLRQHGVRDDDGWTHFADLVVDARGSDLVLEGTGKVVLEIRAPKAPEAEGDDAEPDPINVLADAVVVYLEAHGGEYGSQRELEDGLRADEVKFRSKDLGPALTRLERRGRLERPKAQDRKPRPGRLKPASQGSEAVGEEVA